MEPTNENNGGMAKWQAGCWVKNCTQVNYPHYCMLANNIAVLRKELRGVAAGILEEEKAENATKQEQQNVMEQEKQDATKKYIPEDQEKDVCKDCHKVHSVPTPNCRLA
jgi:sRNA-binding protein